MVSNGRAWLAMLVIAALNTGCESVSTTQGGVVGIERQQRMSSLVSEQQLRQGAVQAYKEELGNAQTKGNLNADPVLTERVRAVSRRIIPATSAFRPDAPGWPWEVNVIRSDQVNAWCMPGGKIAFYTGLIQKLSLNDDEIAAVMGHEVAHALREHARERASEQIGAQLGISVVAAALGGGQMTADLLGGFYNVGFNLPHSRLHETEADRIGVELAARAGYNPQAAVGLWQKMAQAGSGKGPEFLSTHPSDAARQRDLEAYATRVQPLYEQARRGR